MAIRAVVLDRLPMLVLMADLAFHLPVPLVDFVCGLLVMIKHQILPDPSFHLMAIYTFWAQLILVRIFSMADIAFFFQKLDFHAV